MNKNIKKAKEILSNLELYDDYIQREINDAIALLDEDLKADELELNAATNKTDRYNERKQF